MWDTLRRPWTAHRFVAAAPFRGRLPNDFSEVFRMELRLGEPRPRRGVWSRHITGRQVDNLAVPVLLVTEYTAVRAVFGSFAVSGLEAISRLKRRTAESFANAQQQTGLGCSPIAYKSRRCLPK